MEQGIKLIDFETVDQMVQVHGTVYNEHAHMRRVESGKIDHEGVPPHSNQQANMKAALSTVSDLLLKYYPEFFVRVPLHRPRAPYNPGPLL